MLRKSLLLFAVVLLTGGVALVPYRVRAQAGFNDDRVMIQGFYWESYRHGQGDPDDERRKHFVHFGDKKWYEIVEDVAAALRVARFDMIWLPPPSNAGGLSAGYNPQRYFRMDNSYGDAQQHRDMLVALLQNGVEPIADIVLNHRDGVGGWCDFEDPAWGTWSITGDDEAFTNADSSCFSTPDSERGAGEERPTEYTNHGGTTYQYGSFRDIDHTNTDVRRDIVRYLKYLKSFGYRGWRYDMVHGFHAKWISVYNRESHPTFSVGEYDWGAHDEQRGWMWHTATEPGNLQTSSSVFDFSTQFALKDNKGNYGVWYGLGHGLGMVGDTTDGHAWKTGR
ncbi:MAG: hypothetical protein KIT00_04825 [Rhodospirillales bacterium]|nr:hypothetical protein [Rhodospirillales bacterium]